MRKFILGLALAGATVLQPLALSPAYAKQTDAQKQEAADKKAAADLAKEKAKAQADLDKAAARLVKTESKIASIQARIDYANRIGKPPKAGLTDRTAQLNSTASSLLTKISDAGKVLAKSS